MFNERVTFKISKSIFLPKNPVLNRVACTALPFQILGILAVSIPARHAEIPREGRLYIFQTRNIFFVIYFCMYGELAGLKKSIDLILISKSIGNFFI